MGKNVKYVKQAKSKTISLIPSFSLIFDQVNQTLRRIHKFIKVEPPPKIHIYKIRNVRMGIWALSGGKKLNPAKKKMKQRRFGEGNNNARW